MRELEAMVQMLKVAAILAWLIAAVPTNAQVRSAVESELFISPMGEPFRGASSGEQLRVWFSRADTNRDGALSLAEMRADADRFFQVLNINHDREIDPAELRVYEEQIAPEIRVGISSVDGVTSGYGRKYRSRLSSEYSKTGTPDAPLERDSVRRGAGRFGLLATPNPVASTDANLNRGISAAEFERAARDRFALLDANHDGHVRLDELPSLPSRLLRKPRRVR